MGLSSNGSGIGASFRYIEVRVAGDLGAAREVLGDLGDKIRIVTGGKAVAATG